MLNNMLANGNDLNKIGVLKDSDLFYALLPFEDDSVCVLFVYSDEESVMCSYEVTNFNGQHKYIECDNQMYSKYELTLEDTNYILEINIED